MPNSFYNRVFNPLPGQRVDEQGLKDECQRIQQGFDGVETVTTGLGSSITTGLALKANLAGGNVWSGPQDYSGATMTVAAPTLAGHAANKQFVEQIAFSTALPGIAGNAGKQLGTNGTIVFWEAKDLPALVGGDIGKIVVVGAGPTYTLVTGIPASTPRSARTSNTMLVAADKGKLIDITSGSFTQTADTAANLGTEWSVWLTNSGTGTPIWNSTSLAQGTVLMLHSDGTTLRTYVLRWPRQVFVVRDEKTNTTNGGTSTTGVWGQRDLNTSLVNSIPGASLSSNNIILTVPGTYRFKASAPASNSNGHQCRLYNVTAGAVSILGLNAYAASGNGSSAVLNGEVTISSTTTFRLEHRCSAGQANIGYGLANSLGNAEVYSEIDIERVG